MNNSNRKQSILVGGLISSIGIFASKILGLLYVSAYYPIIGNGNLFYYSQSYNIYSYVLNVATAGLPFAIATLVARYASRNDYHTTLLVKRISFVTMLSFGVICALGLILGSPAIASILTNNTGNDPILLSRVLMILAMAIIVVPVLSSLRGFYQGLKEMQLYSTSQIYEQLIRIVFLLAASAFAVYVLKLDRIWGVYFGVMAASVAALATIFYIRFKGKSKLEEVEVMAKEQPFRSKITSQEILKELIFLAIPFFLNALFGYSDGIINQMQLDSALTAFDPSLAAKLPSLQGDSMITVYSNAMFSYASKVIAIPMVLAPGFSSAIIPYITTAIEERKPKLVKKYIVDCLESVIYITLPICMAIFVFAEPILYVLFGVRDFMDVNAYTLKWYALEGLLATVIPVTASLVMVIGERKRIIFNTFMFTVVKFATNYFLVSIFGVAGFVLSSFLAYMVMLALNMRLVQKKYPIKLIYMFRKLIFIGIGLLAFYLVAQCFGFIGFLGYGGSRVVAMIKLGIAGIVSMLVYFGVTAYFQIPQVIFNFDSSKLTRRIKRIFKR